MPGDTDGKLDIPVSKEAAATGSNNGNCMSLLTSSLSWLPRIFPFKDATLRIINDITLMRFTIKYLREFKNKNICKSVLEECHRGVFDLQSMINR